VKRARLPFWLEVVWVALTGPAMVLAGSEYLLNRLPDHLVVPAALALWPRVWA
jgi:hypothetical protein